MKRLSIASFLLFFLFSISTQASVLTFDDITTSDELYPVSTYGGFTWDNLGVLTSQIDYPSSIGGYNNGTVSGEYVAFNGLGNPLTVTNSVFDFIGAYLTGAWNYGLTIEVTGMLGGTTLYSQAITVDSDAATWFEFNFLGIDELIFTSSGGTNAGYGNGGTHFVMDNFTYNASPVPIPATILLLGSSILGIFGYSKHNRTA